MNKELLAEHAFRIRKGVELGFLALGKSALFPVNLRRSVEAVPEEVLSAYEEYGDEIARVYGTDHLKDDYLFHGTGRYHYKPNGNHKYDNFTNTEKIDILKTVLTDGLQPQTDIWIPTPGNNPTVSLTRQRFYSRWYADRHNHKPLEWSFGNSFDWAFNSVVRTIGDAMSVPYIFMLLRSMSKKHLGLLGSAQKWVSDVRNDLHSRSDYTVVWKSKSTIEDNFGVVVGIDRKKVASYDLHLLKRSESRTLNPVSPDSFSFIEVPLAYVATAKSVAAEYGQPDLVILPTECVDFHLSKMPLGELTAMNTEKTPKKPQLSAREAIVNLRFTQLNKSYLLEAAKHGSPFELLAQFDQEPILRDLLSQKSSWEGYTIRYHTLCGLTLLDKYFEKYELPGDITPTFFKIFYAMHDIGDSLGKSTYSKLAFNKNISVELFSQLGFSPQEIKLTEALLSDDSIGSYLKKMGVIFKIVSKMPQPLQLAMYDKITNIYTASLQETQEKIEKMAEIAQLPPKDFLSIMTLFHMIDAGTYTREGGSIGTLNYVFSFNEQGGMSYSETIQDLMSVLEDRFA